MTGKTAPQPDPSVIPTIPNPPFARLPDPASLFAARAARLRRLAPGHGLGPYLEFLAALVEAQHGVAAAAPKPVLPTDEALAVAHRHAMPPLSRSDFAPDGDTSALIDGIINAMTDVAMPDTARAALLRVGALDMAGRHRMISGVLADTIPADEQAEHALVAAALQVDFARRAAGLLADSLKQVGEGVCPTCGSGPVASVIVEWPRYEGTRYCACGLCGTLWNYVRAKCTLCGDTGSISFRELAGGDGGVKAEVCGACDGYVKVLYHGKNPHLDPVADDVASVALDLLLKDDGLRRGANNPFLSGY